MASEVDPGSPELSIQLLCEWWAMRVQYRMSYVCGHCLSSREGGRSRWEKAKVQLLPKCRGLAKGMFGCGLVRTVSVAHLCFSPSK